MIRTSSSHSICVRKKKKTNQHQKRQHQKATNNPRSTGLPAQLLQSCRHTEKKVTNQFVFQSSSYKNTEHTKPISFFFQGKKKKKNPTSCQEYALITTFFFYIYLYIIIITNAKTFIPKFNIGSIATTQWMFGLEQFFVVALFGSTQLSLVRNCWRITADFFKIFFSCFELIA